MPLTDGPLLSFVRGDTPSRDLRQHGIRVRATSGMMQVASGDLEVEDVRAADVLHGARRWRDDPAELKLWAQLVLAIDPINLDLQDASRYDQLTLELLWDIADGHVPTKIQLVAIEQMRLAE